VAFASTKSIDLNSGRPVRDDALTPSIGKSVRNVCPAAPGAKDWHPSAWSPKTQLLYVPHQHLCMNFKTADLGYIEGTPYVGADVDMFAGPGGYRGEFMAWDPIKRSKVWSIKEKFPVWSGALVTAGNVAFYGTMDRHSTRWFDEVVAVSDRAIRERIRPRSSLHHRRYIDRGDNSHEGNRGHGPGCGNGWDEVGGPA
jgi:hypothetical protein